MVPQLRLRSGLYTAKKLANSQSGYFGSITVGVYLDNNQIGQYERNYHTNFECFFPFEANGKELALYSPDYNLTRIMSLPDCIDIGGETWLTDAENFCPVEYYVPAYFDDRCEDDRTDNSAERYTVVEDQHHIDESIVLGSPIEFCNFGFVAGCQWGDDGNWKIQYLDLSKAEQGNIKRDDRFGYIRLQEGMSLKQAVKIFLLHEDTKSRIHAISITHEEEFNSEGKRLD